MSSEEVISALDLVANAGQINSAKYLFVRSAAENSENTLTLIADEGVPNPERTPDASRVPSALAHLLQGGVPINITPDSRSFELYWDTYVAYLITNELLAFESDDNVYAGTKLRLYSRSKFHEFIRATTNGLDAFLHYRLNCENHVIDVASQTPPRISVTLPHHD